MRILQFTKVLMRNMFGKPATRNYPVIPRAYTERTRGHVSINIDDCIFCGKCSRHCPTNAIKITNNAKEKSFSIERMLCIQCNCCVEKCIKGCLKMEDTYTNVDTEKVVDKFAKEAPAKPKVEVAEKKEEATAEVVKEA